MKQNVHKTLTIIAAILTLIFFASFILSKIELEPIRNFILSFGIFAPLGYILFIVVTVIIAPLPSIPLNATAGTVFGGFLGGLYTVIGELIGACIAFLIARYLKGKFMQKYVKVEKLISEKLSDKYLFLFILVSRLLPLFHFDLISYAAGLTPIKLWKFAIATFIGIIPMNFLIAYTGETFFLGNIWINIAFSLVFVFLFFVVAKHFKKYLDNLNEKGSSQLKKN
ncbi:TVP38/TMEM64 family protein [Candidatus Woesearchaeota archaeon]|nr:MAG: TVP38/TMEM64 family protein [Candidatus Woesearchaeota archaeon]